MQTITTATPVHAFKGWIIWLEIDGKKSIAIVHPDKAIATQRASTIAGMLRDVLTPNTHLEF